MSQTPIHDTIEDKIKRTYHSQQLKTFLNLNQLTSNPNLFELEQQNQSQNPYFIWNPKPQIVRNSIQRALRLDNFGKFAFLLLQNPDNINIYAETITHTEYDLIWKKLQPQFKIFDFQDDELSTDALNCICGYKGITHRDYTVGINELYLPNENSQLWQKIKQLK